MRRRALRSQIYLPTVRFGVRDSDWKFVFLISGLSYTIPFLLELRCFNIPLPLPVCLSALGSSVAFFNWTRIGRKPNWLEQQLLALRERPCWPRRLPCDRRFPRAYLIDKTTPTPGPD